MELEKRFWHLVGTSSTGRIDYPIISGLVSPPLPEALVPGLFRAFDENQVRYRYGTVPTVRIRYGGDVFEAFR